MFAHIGEVSYLEKLYTSMRSTEALVSSLKQRKIYFEENRLVHTSIDMNTRNFVRFRFEL